MDKRPNIVVLDGYALNPGDLDWAPFSEWGKLDVHPRTPETDQVVERGRTAEILLTNKTPLTADALSQMPNLRYIGVLATGFNNVDTAYAASRGIVVTNVPGYGTDSVAQITFALLLELCHHVQLHSEAVRRGDWARNPDFCFSLTPQVELAGKTMGIVGLGRIGRRVAQLAEAFNMRVLAAASHNPDEPDHDTVARRVLPQLLEEADVVSLHCPLTPETSRLINRERITLMKPSAFLINTARGGLIDEDDLARALHHGRIAGAGLDVLTLEPPRADNPLVSAPRCVITPHISWSTQEARKRLFDEALLNLTAFLQGRPRNVVNG